MTSKRSIFEDVTETGSNAGPAAPKGKRPDRSGARRAIARWLMVIFALVLAMIVIGGLTRLTDSGLSITEWDLVKGAVPPLNTADWQTVFDKYRASPEYRLQNAGMTLAEFKTIFWWEWRHRFLGRFIGLVWAGGFIWFLARRQVPVGWTPRLLALGVLGGLQGLVGWWMVSSGLEGRMVDVASYRLAIHLGLAFTIFGMIAWLVFELGRSPADLLQARRRREAGLMRLAGILVALLFVQVLLGALVAGIDAGRNFPTWPDMSGEFLPAGSFDLSPRWSNFFENAGLVQFNHRMSGYLAFFFGLFVWWRARRSPLASVRFRFNVLAVVLTLQVVLGITTVLYGAQLHVAITHQLLAVILFAVTLRARFEAAYPAEQKIARG